MTFDFLDLHERAIRIRIHLNKLIRTPYVGQVHLLVWRRLMSSIVPDVARRILERACERLKLRANSNGECFGGEIMDSLREAGVELGAHHVEILQTRTLLVRSMELCGEAYPASETEVPNNRTRPNIQNFVEVHP